MLLEMEYNADKEEYRRMAEARGLPRSIKRGDAWAPVRVGKSFYNSLNQLCVEVFRTADTDIEHNFEFGRSIEIFELAADGTAGKSLAGGTVSYVDGGRMVCVVHQEDKVVRMQTAPAVGVRLFFDETSYRLMFDALERTMRAKGRLGYLRDLFYSNQKAERLSFADVGLPYLNATQQHAVGEVLRAKDVAIVHGPPGTGKTTTLVEAVYETLRRESQVLVCAQSNMAVDWISEKLVDRGVNVLRIGNPTRVNDKMLSFTYERRFESHPDYPTLWALRKAIREMRGRRRRGDDNYHQKLDRLRSRATELEIRINGELFGEARVVACTLTGAANRLLDGRKFGTLFIDEAAQALEAACWIAIRRAGRVVLAGDHCQLPPTVKSVEAMKAGLGVTLMERIVKSKPEVVTLLTVQYRMNDDIMRFSSRWFYGGRVVSAPEVSHRGILDLDTPISWIDPAEWAAGAESDVAAQGAGAAAVDDAVAADAAAAAGEAKELFREEFVAGSFGRINKAEAHLTLLALEQYFRKIGPGRILSERIDVGIISPYRAQVQYLRQLLAKSCFFKPFRRMVSVNTVDGFQGQERDIIMISLVRSNDEGQIGFLRDLRRMNVAITRARMKLIILGSRQTMAAHPFYRELWEYVEKLADGGMDNT